MRAFSAVFLLAAFTACSATVETNDVEAVLELSGDAAEGETLYVAECERCHGADGAGVSAADFAVSVPASSDEELAENILSGPGYMPNFVNTLDSQQVADIVSFLRLNWAE